MLFYLFLPSKNKQSYFSAVTVYIFLHIFSYTSLGTNKNYTHITSVDLQEEIKLHISVIQRFLSQYNVLRTVLL